MFQMKNLFTNIVRVLLKAKQPLYQNHRSLCNSTGATNASYGRSPFLESVSKNALCKNIYSATIHGNNLIYPTILQNVAFMPARTFSSGDSRSSNRKTPDDGLMPLPRLIYVRNPFTWLANKFYFTVLRSSWDPGFKESEFKRGSQQAIATVTNIISTQKNEDLLGLLTRPARMRLAHEISREWTIHQIKAIGMEPHHLQITVPRKVWFLRLANNNENKYCNIDMVFIGLKWASQHYDDGMVFAEIFARFHRDYTEHAIPDWTIAHFKVTRFEIWKRK